MVDMIVLCKQVPDTEASQDSYEIDPVEKKIVPRGIPPVINPFDENALEVAFRIKESYGGTITVLSVGNKLSKWVFMKTLALGIDKLILVQDEILENIDSRSTALVLSTTIQKIIKKYDLILAGRQAGDWDEGQVNLILAEMLKIPCITLARKIDIENNDVLVETITPDGYELIKAKMPALVTITNEAGELRYASITKMKTAKDKPITILSTKDIEIDIANLSKRKLHSLIAPDWKRECKIIEGATPEEKALNLLQLLKDIGII